MVVVDTSCLITLDRIGNLETLNKVFGKITVTPEIKQEFKNPLPHWVEIVAVDVFLFLTTMIPSPCARLPRQAGLPDYSQGGAK